MTQVLTVVRPGRKDALDPRIFDVAYDETRLDELDPPSLYSVGGREMALYPISALATMLGRSPITLRKWEQKGILPSTPFRLIFDPHDLRGSRRKYSRELILATVKIAREEGVLIMFESQIKNSNFTPRVQQLFNTAQKNTEQRAA